MSSQTDANTADERPVQGFAELTSQIGTLQRLCCEQAQELAKLKGAAQGLRHSEPLYRTFAASLPNGAAFVVDRELRYLLAGGEALQKAGMAPADLEGKTLFEAHGPDLAQQYEPNYRKALEGERLNFEHSSHQRRYITHLGPIRNEHGFVYAALAVSYDITGRKRAEEALRESEERFRTMADGLPLIIWVHDAEGRQQFVNRTFLEFFGVPQEEMQGGRWKMLVHPDDGQAYADEFYACVRNRRPFHALARVQRFDKQWRWIESWGKPRFSSSGVYLGQVGTSADITERKQAEEALRASEEKFRNLFDSMAEGFVVGRMIRDEQGQAVDYQFTEVNRAYELLTGIDRRQSLKKTIRQLIPDLEPAWIENHARVAETGEPLRWESYNARTKGYYDIFTYRPAPGTFASVFLNVTARRRAEEAMKENERLFHAAIDHFPGIFNIYDSERRLRYVNAQAVKISGLRADQMIGRRDEELIPAHICSRYLPYLEEVYRSKQPQSLELRLSRPFGEAVQIIHYMPVLDEGGEIRNVLGIGTDITARKRTEEALRQALSKAEEGDRMLSALMQYVPEGITIADPEFNLVRVSRHGEELLGGPQAGKSAGEVAAQCKVYHPDGVTPMAFEELPLVRAIAAGEVVKDAEIVQLSSAGERLPLLCTAGPLRDRAGNIAGGIVAFRDITDRKQTERQLRQLNETLEAQVSERTQLAEARARQLQALAIELIETEEKERRQFADLLHDDLQQMLAAAKMQLQGVAANLPHAPVLENVTHILEASIAKSRQLSHDLSPAVLQTSGLAPALQWLGRQMRSQFGLAVRIENDLEQDVIHGSLKIFVFRAVRELLFNIVKHAGAKSARVHVCIKNGSLTTTVSDRGTGFDPALLEDHQGKIGFGILTIRERARYIGGSLRVESQIGHGSRFILTIPLRAAQPHEVVAEELPTKAPAVQRAAEITRVLLADDHGIMRQGLIRLLAARAGIQVSGEAANGREAVDKARRLQPDVIVMDISMPVMDGIEATRRIKAEMPYMRVVGLSMYEDEPVCTAMREAGAEALVSKTDSPAALLKAICGSGQS